MQQMNLTMGADDLMLPCLNKKFFGIECPGCGIQRSVMLLWEGDFIGAFYMYPAIYPMILLFGFIFANILFKIKNANKIIPAMAILTVAFILINYILKFL